MKIKNLNLLALPLGLAMATPDLNAQTVAWGTTWSALPLSFDSHGNIDTGANALTWELGYFSGAYVPDQTNWATWVANWNPVATSSHQFEVAVPVEDSVWKVAANSQVLQVGAGGKQVYVFAYNDISKIGTSAGEVLMYREDNLVFPSTAFQISFDIANDPSDPADDGFTVIWGRVDRNLYADVDWPGPGILPVNGGVLVGGGFQSNPVPDSQATPYNNNGTYEAQSATWSAIPEPTGALLVGGLGVMLFLRRRR